MNDAALSTTSAETGVDRPGDTIVLPGQAPDGTPILSVLIKRTYRIRSGARCVRAERDRKLVPGDRHFGDPMNTCVEFESDFVPYKLVTDVVLNGDAIAPGGSPVYELTAALTIGDVVRTVQVIGDRNAQYRAGAAPVFTDPVPFAKMPVRYDLAFGGVDTQSNPKMACVYGRNHLGRGFAIRNVPEVVDGLALPNIEHPTDRPTPDRLCCGHFVHMDTLPEPLGFGWMMKGWRPRLLLAGIMPGDVALAGELRQAYRLVAPPHQREMYDKTELQPMDFRFFNGASTGLVLPYLQGSEWVRTRHLSPEGRLEFDLPDDKPKVGIDIGSGNETPVVLLQTVMIRMSDLEVDLVWRAAITYPGPDWLPEMQRLDVTVF